MNQSRKGVGHVVARRAPRRSAPAVFATLLLTAVCMSAAPLSAQVPNRFDFVDARLVDVIRTLASALGLNVVMSDVPDRVVTFSTNAPVRDDEIGSVLESVLEANSLVLVQKGPVAQVLPADSAPPTGVIRFGLELGEPRPLGLVTQVVPLQSIRADEAASILKQVGGKARIEPVARTNALMITDMSTNIARYLELLRGLDERPQGEAGLRTYVIPLGYANAQDLAASLNQLFGLGGGASTTSLSDLSLGRSLDSFRDREAEAFRLRQETTPTITMPTLTMPGDTSQASLVGRTTIVADPPTNSLLIRTAPPNFPLLQETIQTLDRRPPQVLLEVTVAEVSLGKGEEFGIDWSVLSDNVTVRRGTPVAPDSLTSIPDFVLRVVSVDRANVRAMLSALATTSNVSVLSTPEILAVNNREARIVVGNRVPFVASTRLGDFALDRSVQYEDVGTALTIIPTINDDDYVSVQILQEVNALTSQAISSAFDAPVISTREASTRAIIRDGQTVVIGGLIGESTDTFESGIPFLKDIPLLGYLFKRQVRSRTRTELALFVTPYIVRSDADADAIRERLRNRMDPAPTLPPPPRER
jgi:general secretion pathway protein D